MNHRKDSQPNNDSKEEKKKTNGKSGMHTERGVKCIKRDRQAAAAEEEERKTQNFFSFITSFIVII